MKWSLTPVEITTGYLFIVPMTTLACIQVFFIEYLKMKFQIRNILYSSGNLNVYINENEMSKY
jgi:hypothetical protein